jgi:hypothetical protein
VPLSERRSFELSEPRRAGGQTKEKAGSYFAASLSCFVQTDAFENSTAINHSAQSILKVGFICDLTFTQTFADRERQFQK